MIEINTEYPEIRHSVDLYDLTKDDSCNREYPPSLFNKWFFHEEHQNKQDLFENYCTLVQVDEQTYYNLYRRIFNPINIHLYGGIGKFHNKNLIGVMTVYLKSIDDTSYGCMFENIPRDKFEEIFEKIDEYIKSKTYINCFDFVNFLIGLGGTENSW